MIYSRVAIETPAVLLPPNVLTSEQLEQQLQPAYDRIGLRVGRLELMTGIKERRFWNPGTLPSQAAAQVGKQALDECGLQPQQVDCLINCSVSRDCVEPATSTFVHHLLGLSQNTINFDLSNACLGIASGIITLAAMVEAGLIRTGLAVAAENSAPLVRNTVKFLNEHEEIGRQAIKPHFASLTIGSCATAIVVRNRSLAPRGHALLAAASLADTSHNTLCQGNTPGGMTDQATPLMQTDSPVLMACGVQLAHHMWDKLKENTGWQDTTPDLICTHQVGKGHRKLLYDMLNLDLRRDFSTFETLGNCGSASLTATLATAARKQLLKTGHNVALLGIGSGINCTGLAVTW